jgi:PHR domain
MQKMIPASIAPKEDSFDCKEFVRFDKIGNDSWAIGSVSTDAIIFEAKRDVKVYGIGIYGPKDEKKHNFTIKYQWFI